MIAPPPAVNFVKKEPRQVGLRVNKPFYSLLKMMKHMDILWPFFGIDKP